MPVVPGDAVTAMYLPDLTPPGCSFIKNVSGLNGSAETEIPDGNPEEISAYVWKESEGR